MTPPETSRRRPRATPAAGVTLGALALGLTLTTTYAVPPAAAATPSCAPWQAPQTVPAGVTLAPRIFPTDAATAHPPAPSQATPTTSTHPAATHPTPTPTPHVVCRAVPPTPFAHPAWEPETVVGGSRLAETGVVVDRPVSVPGPPEVFDVSYVIADLGTGEILAAKSPHAWLRPASTLKTLTALTLMPRLDPRRVVVAKQDAQDAAGSRVGVLAGNPYPVSSLFDAMLMFSANDAVYALADAAGGYDATVALMNEKAEQIGAHDTVTVDPSGLDEGEQRSSAYDLALIGRDAMRLPAFRATITKRDAVFPGSKDKQGRVLPAFHVYNINELLTHYPGTIGIKPGRTDRAQHTFIGAATRGGRTLIVSQMGSVTGSWKPTAALLDWGFANAERVTPVGRLVEPGEAAAPIAAPTLSGLLAGDDSAAAPGSSGADGAAALAPVGASAAGTTWATWAAAFDRKTALGVLGAAGAVATAAAALLVARRRGRSRRRRA